MGKDKKSNPFIPGMITNPCRIVTIGGRVIAGTPVGWFDDAVVISAVSGDDTIVRMDAIEAVWDGLISPKAQAIIDGGKKDDGAKEEGNDGLQKP